MAIDNARAGTPWSSDTTREPGSSDGNRRSVELVQQKANEVTRRIAEGAQSTFEQAKGLAADQARVVAGVFERAVEHLRENDQPKLADQAQRLGKKVERASDYLQRRSAREIGSDFEQFARRSPVWVIAGAFLVGLMGARFLKSSERGRNGT